MPLSALFGIVLAAWIEDQWALLQDRLWLQPVMFCIGTVIAALGVPALRRGEREQSVQIQ
jgi:membrane protein implicated in regulation of membrane protease activity